MKTTYSLIKKVMVLFSSLLLTFTYGCNNNGALSTPALTSSVQKTINDFGYTISIPKGWKIIRNDISNLELSSDLNKDEDFVIPKLTIFKPDLKSETEEGFISKALKGTKSYKQLDDVTDLTKYKLSAFGCVQSSAHKDYTCYYAFITADSDFVVVFLTGDTSVKDELKSIFYNTIKTLEKSSPNGTVVPVVRYNRKGLIV